MGVQPPGEAELPIRKRVHT